MSREIKFRAWDNKNKKWLLGYEYKNLGGFSLFGECMLFGEWEKVLNEFLFSKKDSQRPEDLNVMQYTGLKDKNGKEIYEGDIVKTDKNWGGYIKEIEDVRDIRFLLSDGWLTGQEQNGKLVAGEVIGNVYQNKELLKNE